MKFLTAVFLAACLLPCALPAVGAIPHIHNHSQVKTKKRKASKVKAYNVKPYHVKPYKVTRTKAQKASAH